MQQDMEIKIVCHFLVSDRQSADIKTVLSDFFKNIDVIILRCHYYVLLCCILQVLKWTFPTPTWE